MNFISPDSVFWWILSNLAFRNRCPMLKQWKFLYFPYTAEVRPDWAPHGTLRFLELAAAGANLNVIVIHLYKLNLRCTCKCNLNNLISLSFHVHVSMILLEQVTLMTVHFIVLCLVASWQQVSSWRCLLSPKRCGCDLFFSLDLCRVAKKPSCC